ncbi:MAG TPA: NifU family protein [Myxococcaceae bacterium]|nr:NifU family protein [Myxococcaceae bacterium]
MSVNIQLEWTPNPSTLKYVVDRTLLPRGAMSFTQREGVEARSPLAAKLMGIEGVTGVMLGSNFVTVTKGEAGEWDALNDQVMATLDTHLGGNEPVLTEAALAEASNGHGASDGEVERKIREILDAEIRPAVMQDGGDITLDRYEAGIVYLHMRGSCSGCPSSTMTLKMGIENRLRESVPEVVEVMPV